MTTSPAKGDTIRWSVRLNGEKVTYTGTVHTAHDDRWLVDLGGGRYYDLHRGLWEATGEVLERAVRPVLVAVSS